MSRIIESLIGRKCIIETEDSVEDNCLVTDVDDIWIKVEIPVKKSASTTKIFRLESIDNIEVIE